MRHLASFTEKELKLLETWSKLIDEGFRSGLYDKAAAQLKLSPVTVRSRVSRMRTNKYENALQFVREYRSWQQRFYQRTGGKFNPLARSGLKRGRKQ